MFWKLIYTIGIAVADHLWGQFSQYPAQAVPDASEEDVSNSAEDNDGLTVS